MAIRCFWPSESAPGHRSLIDVEKIKRLLHGNFAVLARRKPAIQQVWWTVETALPPGIRTLFGIDV
jgi:hypothetical protein